MSEDHPAEGELAALFESREDVAFAALFGSAATGRQTAESDVDIAVYFRSAAVSEGRRFIDLEEVDETFPAEYDLWAACENTVGRDVDLVVLNRAPATVGAAALLTGRLLAVNDRTLYRRYFNLVTLEAEDFRGFVEDYVAVKKRSRSLSDVDRERLYRIVEFLRGELTEADTYLGISHETYRTDGLLRRASERWVENLVNASIDLAKIVVASQGKPVAQTYRGVLESLDDISQFKGLGRPLAENARVRNALAHEYLDLRYTQVSRAAEGAESLYGRLVSAAEAWIDDTSSSRKETL
ncbi:MAG: type VII toxin-antitoxin system MntA family adenylyltransferase antitoxin [Spirochaetota bacterium]